MTAEIGERVPLSVIDPLARDSKPTRYKLFNWADRGGWIGIWTPCWRFSFTFFFCLFNSNCGSLQPAPKPLPEIPIIGMKLTFMGAHGFRGSLIYWFETVSLWTRVLCIAESSPGFGISPFNSFYLILRSGELFFGKQASTIQWSIRSTTPETESEREQKRSYVESIRSDCKRYFPRYRTMIYRPTA